MFWSGTIDGDLREHKGHCRFVSGLVTASSNGRVCFAPNATASLLTTSTAVAMASHPLTSSFRWEWQQETAPLTRHCAAWRQATTLQLHSSSFAGRKRQHLWRLHWCSLDKQHAPSRSFYSIKKVSRADVTHRTFVVAHLSRTASVHFYVGRHSFLSVSVVTPFTVRVSSPFLSL